MIKWYISNYDHDGAKCYIEAMWVVGAGWAEWADGG